jgi:hypothetical protein
VPYRIGDFANHLAGFVISPWLALLCLFVILIFPILPTFGLCKIAHTFSASNYDFLKRHFSLWGWKSRVSAVSAFSCCCLITALHLQLASLPQRSLMQYNIQYIFNCLCCSRSVFLVVSRPQASFCIASCTIPQLLRLCLFPSLCCLHSLGDVNLWNIRLISHICQFGTVKSSSSKC